MSETARRAQWSDRLAMRWVPVQPRFDAAVEQQRQDHATDEGVACSPGAPAGNRAGRWTLPDRNRGDPHRGRLPPMIVAAMNAPRRVSGSSPGFARGDDAGQRFAGDEADDRVGDVVHARSYSRYA